MGPPELLDRLDLWVRIVANNLHLPNDQLRWWEKSLTALRDLRLVSLDRFAAYALRTREYIDAEGMPLLQALGAALPAIRLPRDTCYFNAIKEKTLGFASAWRAQFGAAHRRRAGLLLKQSAAQLLLSEDDLTTAFSKVRDAIPEALYPTINAFIAAPSGWNAQAAQLAECEWESIKPLFDGLQREKFDLWQSTLDFYDEGQPGLISNDDRDYLRLLIGRRTTEPSDYGVAFYEAHRNELKTDRKLKSAWDRFVFGRPIETTDFMSGLCSAFEPLFNRASIGGKHKLFIRCERATKREFRDLNVEAGLYFAHRYAGLRRLFGGQVHWEVGDLFEFPRLVDGWKAAKKGGLNHSIAKPALQLKFLIVLETTTDTGDVQSCSAQIVWRYETNAVTSQLVEDWYRLSRPHLSHAALLRVVDINTLGERLPCPKSRPSCRLTIATAARLSQPTRSTRISRLVVGTLRNV